MRLTGWKLCLSNSCLYGDISFSLPHTTSSRITNTAKPNRYSRTRKPKDPAPYPHDQTSFKSYITEHFDLSKSNGGRMHESRCLDLLRGKLSGGYGLVQCWLQVVHGTIRNHLIIHMSLDDSLDLFGKQLIGPLNHPVFERLGNKIRRR